MIPNIFGASDAGNSILQEVFGFVKEKPVRSAAKEERLLAGKRARGTAAGLAPPQHIVIRSARSAPIEPTANLKLR
jgi:hypothetical protein